METQLKLIPEQRPQVTNCAIPVDRLPPNEALIGDPPDNDFLDSIARHGVIEPIIVIDHGSRFEVMGGRRRIKACRIVGIEQIAARVYPAHYTAEEVLVIMLNEQRRKNVASDFVSVRSLFQKGATEKEITAATGMPAAKIRSLLRLNNLIPDLMDAFLGGTIATSTAQKLARLSHEIQQDAADQLEEDGKLTGADVERLRRVQTNGIVDTLPQDLFGTPQAPQPGADNLTNWQDRVMGHLEKALANVPADNDHVREQITQAITQLAAPVW